jgi:hypothetical protein
MIWALVPMGGGGETLLLVLFRILPIEWDAMHLFFCTPV